jgi:hypothetical protein
MVMAVKFSLHALNFPNMGSEDLRQGGNVAFLGPFQPIDVAGKIERDSGYEAVCGIEDSWLQKPGIARNNGHKNLAAGGDSAGGKRNGRADQPVFPPRGEGLLRATSSVRARGVRLPSH